VVAGMRARVSWSRQPDGVWAAFPAGGGWQGSLATIAKENGKWVGLVNHGKGFRISPGFPYLRNAQRWCERRIVTELPA
jgi:hypothetical protein